MKDEKESKIEINLQDMDFDFEDYFKRAGEKFMCDVEMKEFPARIMGVIARKHYGKSSEDGKIEEFAEKYIADAFFNILGGVPFRNALPTPFEPSISDLSAIGERAFKASNMVNDRKKNGEKVSKALMEVAMELNISYESARSAYYTMKRVQEKGGCLPDNFYKKQP